MATVSVRYITDDLDAAVAFYVERLGFDVRMRPGPGFAMLSREDLRLLLNGPGAGGAGGAAAGGARAGRPTRRRTGAGPSPVAGIASRSRSPTPSGRWRRCGRPGHASAARSSR